MTPAGLDALIADLSNGVIKLTTDDARRLAAALSALRADAEPKNNDAGTDDGVSGVIPERKPVLPDAHMSIPVSPELEAKARVALAQLTKKHCYFRVCMEHADEDGYVMGNVSVSALAHVVNWAQAALAAREAKP